MNYFIIGTDTGVGKTLLSCALLHAFAAQGKRVVGMKPVACGDNLDVKQLRAAGNVPASIGQINPYYLEQAVAPQLAAQFIGITINFSRISESYQELNALAEVVIVEGAGGFRVPLNASQDGADLAVELGLPLILVVGMRLGCLNHALLTVEAIEQRGLTLAGWVANVLHPDMAMLPQNIKLLRQRIQAPLLGEIPYQNNVDARLLAPQLNLDLLEQLHD